MNAKKIIKYLEIPIILAVLAVILVIIYFPLVGHLNEYVISGESDGFAYWAWRNWVASGLIDSLLENKASPIQLVYYGLMINNTIPESGNILDIILISYPLRKIFGFPVSYNLKVLLILLFNGFAGYFVISRLLNNPWIGIVCGSFIMLNPIIFFIIHKARLRDAIIGFMILFLYYLYKAASTFRIKHALLAGVFLGLTSIFYWFYGMFCIWITLALIPMILIQLTRRKKKLLLKVFLKRVALGLIVTTLICIPFAMWYTPLFENVKMLPDVMLFVPYPETGEMLTNSQTFNSLGGYPISLARIILFDSFHLGFFPFYIPFMLAGVFAFFRFRRFHIWLLIIILFFYLFSFGPYLRQTPDVKPDGFYMIGGKPVKMPYYYMFQYIPVAGRLHHPVEGMTMVSIGLMFLSGMGLEAIWRWLRKFKLVRGLFLSVLCIAIIAHTWSLEKFQAFPVYPNLNILAIPRLYTEFGEKGKAGIIELPMDRSVDVRCFYKTYHQQKMLIFNPWNMLLLPMDALPDNRFTWANQNEFFLRDLPISKSLERFGRKESQNLDLEGIREIKKRGYKYIFLHERDFVHIEPSTDHRPVVRGKEDYERFKKELEKHFGKPEIYREFHHCLLSTPAIAGRNDYPHFSHEIAVFEIDEANE